MKLLKIPHEKPIDIFSFYEPTQDMIELSKDVESPFELLQKAIAHHFFADAVTFLAHGLPIRESIWWASICASCREDWTDDERNAITSAKSWVHSPDETTRRHAEEMAKIATLGTGAGWAAQAAFWSGGSMTVPSAPVVPPPPYLYAQAVAGCINLTAVLPDGACAQQRYQQFLEMGLDLARGGNGEIEGN